MRGQQQDRAAARHAGRSALYFTEEKVTMKHIPLILILVSAHVESGTASESRIYATVRTDALSGLVASGTPSESRIYAAVSTRSAPSSPVITSDQSFKNEVQRAIDRGLDWLKADQNTNGWW